MSSNPSLAVDGVGGSGPLLQRDYWAVIDGCQQSPAEVCAYVAEHFCEIAPTDLARFERAGDTSRPLDVGDELRVAIRLTGTFGVRVVHRDGCSFTLATLQGHPEVGRITFGAYRDHDGQVVFHIRSRARSSSALRYAAWLLVGEDMQTDTWTRFVDRVASSTGRGVVGAISERTLEVSEREAGGPEEPTYVIGGK